MVRAEHDADLHEAHSVRRQPPLEPQQAHGVADSRARIHQLGHRHAAVGGLLAAVVADRRDDVGGDAHDAGALGRGEVERQRRGGRGPLRARARGRSLPFGDERVVRLFDGRLKPFERVRHHGARISQRLVLGRGTLRVARSGPRAGVPELDLGLEERRARARGPRDDGLRDPLFFQSVDQSVLVDASQLLFFFFHFCFFFVLRNRREGKTKEIRREKERKCSLKKVKKNSGKKKLPYPEHDDHLDPGHRLVPQRVVRERRPGERVPSDGDPFVQTVGRPRENTIALVAHAAGFRDEPDAAAHVEAALDDVLDRSRRVADAEGARL